MKLNSSPLELPPGYEAPGYEASSWLARTLVHLVQNYLYQLAVTFQLEVGVFPSSIWIWDPLHAKCVLYHLAMALPIKESISKTTTTKLGICHWSPLNWLHLQDIGNFYRGILHRQVRWADSVLWRSVFGGCCIDVKELICSSVSLSYLSSIRWSQQWSLGFCHCVPSLQLNTPALQVSGAAGVDSPAVWSHMCMKWLIAMGFGEEKVISSWCNVLIYVVQHGGISLPFGKFKLRRCVKVWNRRELKWDSLFCVLFYFWFKDILMCYSD